MKLSVTCCAITTMLALAGCASGPEPDADLPPSVGNGIGSQFGNYAARTDGEMRGPSGEHCLIYNWDRPLARGLALRLRSASCDSRERPGWMVSHELSRTVIPLSESNLKDELSGAGGDCRPETGCD